MGCKNRYYAKRDILYVNKESGKVVMSDDWSFLLVLWARARQMDGDDGAREQAAGRRTVPLQIKRRLPQALGLDRRHGR